MLSLLDSLEKDLQRIRAKMLNIASDIEVLQEQYKRLDKDRENVIYAIHRLEEALND